MDGTTEQDMPNGHKHSGTNEFTPLLDPPTEESPIKVNGIHREEDNGSNDKPLPKAQIFVLCYARLVEPVAFFSIFPFVNQMVHEVGNVGEKEVGFYSGLIESLFSLTQMIMMIPLGRAADRFGRKPILVSSLIGISFATALFGLSKTVWQMILFRCLAGLFAGTVVTVRTMISENSTPKTQARAFSFYTFTSNLGIFLGPLIGGSLSNPAEQYAGLFGRSQFFKGYPYALPTFVCGTLAASSAVVSAVFAKETLVRNKNIAKFTPSESLSTWQIVKSPGVPNVLLIFAMVMGLALAYTAIAPLFWFTKPELGGYGFSPLWISIFLGAAGILQAIWTLLVFPSLQQRIGTGGVLRLCSYGFPVFHALNPVTNLLLRKHFKVGFWISASILQVLSSAIGMSFTAVQLAINDISPSPYALGTLNAVALTANSGIRAVAPALFSSIFAISTRTQILWGYLAWLILVLLGLVLVASVRWLPKKAEGKIVENDPTDC